MDRLLFVGFANSVVNVSKRGVYMRAEVPFLAANLTADKHSIFCPE